MKTVNLQLSKELKEAGYPQQGMFWYDGSVLVAKAMLGFFVELNGNQSMLGCGDVSGKPDIWDEEEAEEEITYAPLADEILDQLPRAYEIYRNISHSDMDYTCQHTDENGYVRQSGGETAADAAARMWLYLKKEGLI